MSDESPQSKLAPPGGVLDHVAVLVTSIEAALSRFGPFESEVGEIEDFPTEGTRELYIGRPGRVGRLLLLQPLDATKKNGAAPYARAMKKRGPGIHHLAFRVEKIDAFLVANPGWLLHPFSLKSHAQSSTIWLARPGVALLLEVFENPERLESPPLVTEVSVPVAEELVSMTEPLGIDSGSPAIVCDGKRIEMMNAE